MEAHLGSLASDKAKEGFSWLLQYQILHSPRRDSHRFQSIADAFLGSEGLLLRLGVGSSRVPRVTAWAASRVATYSRQVPVGTGELGLTSTVAHRQAGTRWNVETRHCNHLLRSAVTRGTRYEPTKKWHPATVAIFTPTPDPFAPI